MNQADKILRVREKRGLTISMSIRIFMLIMITVGHLVSHHSQGEIIRISIISTFFLLLLAVFIILIQKGKFFRSIGYASLVVDAFLLCFFPYNWYLSVGFYDNVPAVYLLKTSLPSMAFLFVSVSALAIRPAYPILVAMVFNLIWAFFFYLVFNDPRTEFTDSFIDNFFTEKIIPGYYFTFPLTITGAACMISLVAYSYRKSIQEAVDLEVANSQMSRYFSPGILNEIQNDESIFRAKKSQVVVMFVDIRGFTSMSENMEPEDVVTFLRTYHSKMVEIIYSEGGTIDKFLGDGIMISFGTPNPGRFDVIHSVTCALRMRDKLLEWNRDRKNQGLPEIRQGIGIHSGEVVSGNIGSENRLEYTVIGDTVNLASRIESICKEANEDILISKSIVIGLKKIIEEDKFSSDISQEWKEKAIVLLNRIQSIGETEIRGKQNKIELYKVS